MATYQELYDLRTGESALKNKVKVAVVIAAEGIIQEAAPSAERVAWAVGQLANPDSDGALFNVVLAQNEAAPVASILGASDAVILSAVFGAIGAIAPA